MSQEEPAYKKEKQYSFYINVYQRKSKVMFDWVADYQTEVKFKIQKFLYEAKGARALHLGSGTSNMSRQLINDGFREIVNIDFCENVIQSMQEVHKDVENILKWKVADAANLNDFSDNSFEYVFDKACLDSMFAGELSKISVPSCIKEVHRVLKPGGYYILISLGFFESNDNVLQVNTSKLKMKQLYHHSFFPDGGTSEHYIYVYQKSK